MPILPVVLLLLACGLAAAQEKAYPPIDEQAIGQASAAARLTLPRFFSSLQAGKGQYYAVKLPLPREGGGTELCWVGYLSRNDGRLQGRMDNIPQGVIGPRPGENMTIDPAHIADWMIVHGGQVYGGYTTRVLETSMREDEKLVNALMMRWAPLDAELP